MPTSLKTSSVAKSVVWAGKVLGTVFVTGLFWSVDPLVATVLVTLQEIEAEIETAVKSLGQGAATDRIQATQTLRTWAQYAVEAIPALSAALSDEEEEVRVGAALALEAIGPAARESVPLLVEALGAPSSALRAAASYALSRIEAGGPQAFGALRILAQDPDPEVRVAAALALVSLFPRNEATAVLDAGQLACTAESLLFSSLRKDQGVAAKRLARAMVLLDPARALSATPRLVALAEADDEQSSASAAYALEEFGAASELVVLPYAKQALGGALGQRLAAIQTLGWLRADAEAGTEALAECLDAREEQLAVSAAEALGRLGPKAFRVSLALEQAVRSRSGAPRAAAAMALVRVSPERAEALLPYLGNQDPELALRIRWALLQSAL